jgi:hypothetical protein
MKKPLFEAECEYTDLFCGQANYAWVKRATITYTNPSQRAVVRAAKKALGLTGCKATTYDTGVYLEVRFDSTVLFITPIEAQK